MVEALVLGGGGNGWDRLDNWAVDRADRYRERAARRGAEVAIVAPEEASEAAIGSSPLDPATRQPAATAATAATAGRAQGRDLKSTGAEPEFGGQAVERSNICRGGMGIAHDRVDVCDMTLSVTQLAQYLNAKFRSEAGQTLAEYGILVAGIAVVVIVAAVLFGTNTFNLFSSSASGV